MRLHDLQKNKYGTMTHEEKRINRVDLLNYKSKESQMEAMVPGIHNLSTVGTSPLKRGARNIMSHSRLPTANDLSALSLSQSMKTIQPFPNEQKEAIIKNKEEESNPSRYNPITNPIPWYNQNPYIKRERNTARSSVSLATSQIFS